MSKYQDYSGDAIILKVDGKTVAGAVKVYVSFHKEEYTTQKGIDGSSRQIKNSDRSGKVSITLEGLSIDNATFELIDSSCKPVDILIIDRFTNESLFVGFSAKIETKNRLRNKDKKWVWKFFTKM